MRRPSTVTVLGVIVDLAAILVLVQACSAVETAPTPPPAVVVKAPTVAAEPPATAPLPNLAYANKPHHVEAELACDDCHELARPQAPPTAESCLDCHGTHEQLAKATFVGEHKPNPHESPHYGNDQDCSLCHYEHEPSENMCGDCHDWAGPVP